MPGTGRPGGHGLVPMGLTWGEPAAGLGEGSFLHGGGFPRGVMGRGLERSTPWGGGQEGGHGPMASGPPVRCPTVPSLLWALAVCVHAHTCSAPVSTVLSEHTEASGPLSPLPAAPHLCPWLLQVGSRPWGSRPASPSRAGPCPGWLPQRRGP